MENVHLFKAVTATLLLVTKVLKLTSGVAIWIMDMSVGALSRTPLGEVIALPRLLAGGVGARYFLPTS